MTAVAIQQNVHPVHYINNRQPATSARPSSYQSRLTPLNATENLPDSSAPIHAHGNSNIMAPSVAGPNGSPGLVRGNAEGDSFHQTTPMAGTNGGAPHELQSRRPSSAPGSKNNLVSTFEQIEHQEPERVKHAVKPLLLRSRSEHGLRSDDTDHTDDEIYEWGARHGFEDHYQSEDIISHLANVSHEVLARLVSLRPPHFTNLGTFS
jgi:regulatory associated protein of mTOR